VQDGRVLTGYAERAVSVEVRARAVQLLCTMLPEEAWLSRARRNESEIEAFQFVRNGLCLLIARCNADLADDAEARY
jgi:hypothetical protein